MQTQPISFSIPNAQFEALRRRAGTLNLKPSEYAKRLFDAGYFVRCAAEKGEEPEDAALDRQVREVFLLADCEPEFIAESLRIPEARVKRILDGWRRAARDMIDPPARPVVSGPEKAPTMIVNSVKTLSPPPSPGAGERTGTCTPEEVSVIRNLWREGKSVPAIAEVLGCAPKRIANFMNRHRDICPARAPRS